MTIALVGKYVQLHDAYLSVCEALKHSAIHHGRKLEMRLGRLRGPHAGDGRRAALRGADGVLVPGGFGERGIEGKIEAIEYCREQQGALPGRLPGHAVRRDRVRAQRLRHGGANSSEFDPETPYPVIDLLPEQKKVADMGGTMRLGAAPVKLLAGHARRAAYGDDEVYERHRHRYEVNNDLRRSSRRRGSSSAARSPDGRLVEIVELADHPFFVASQFHPEFKSRPDAPGAAVPRVRRRRDAPARRARGRARGDLRRAGDGRLAARASGALRAPRRDAVAVRVRARRRRRSIAAEVRGLGLEVREDDSRRATGGGAGNLVVRVPGRGEGMPIVLCAHIDTVPVTGEVRATSRTASCAAPARRSWAPTTRRP